MPANFTKNPGPNLVVQIESLRRDVVDQRPRDAWVSVHDGKSLNGSLSETGKLLIQRVLSDNSEVIVLRDELGAETQVTSGPRDIAPTFLPGGDGWLYTRFASGEIMRCSVRGKVCSRIHDDPMIPVFLTPDPDGRYVAYLTSLNTPRVRIVSLGTGEQRELGPSLPCAPAWSGPRNLWVMTSSQMKRKVWAEINVQTGMSTGEVRSVVIEDAQDECRPPAILQHGAHVLSALAETSTILQTSNGK